MEDLEKLLQKMVSCDDYPPPPNPTRIGRPKLECCSKPYIADVQHVDVDVGKKPTVKLRSRQNSPGT